MKIESATVAFKIPDTHPEYDVWKREFSSEAARTTTFTVYFTADAASVVAAQILLSLRHPNNRGPSSHIALELVGGMIDRLHQNGFHMLADALAYDYGVTLKERGGQ